ncbi:MAG: glycosyltransferase [bacterium]|nr:glycosyltransferase [bacterium]
MNNIYLSVVIPSYNETENLKRGVLIEVRDYLAKQKYPWEVIIVDDESPDEEARNLARIFCEQNPGFKFIQAKHGGKVGALWTGIKLCVGEYILFTDMDQSSPINEIEKLLPNFDQGFDIVVGSRGLERKKFSLFRQLSSFIFRNFRRSVLLRKIIDTQAGFKIARTAVVKEIFPLLSVVENLGHVKGWSPGSWDVEYLVAAEVRGYKIVEVPISWEDRDVTTGKKGGSKFIKESIDMVKEVLQVKYYQLSGRYKK